MHIENGTQNTKLKYTLPSSAGSVKAIPNRYRDVWKTEAGITNKDNRANKK